MTEWKKWETGQSCIRKEVTSYKIRTLAGTPLMMRFEEKGENVSQIED